MLTIYSKNNCIKCKQAKAFLETTTVDFREINIDNDKTSFDLIVEKGFQALPVFELNGEFFSFNSISDLAEKVGV